MGEDSVDSERHLDEAGMRRLIGAWARRTEPAEQDAEPVTGLDVLPATGLDVPPAPAEDVIAAARHLATEGRRSRPRVRPGPELRLLAEALVLEEHPSAAGWTDAERRDALEWITLLIHRFGEDGVQRLVDALNARH